MPHAEDPHSALVKAEQDVVVADPQAKRPRHVAVQGRDIARTRGGVMYDVVEDAHGGGAIQAADVGLGLVEPLDPVARHYLLRGKSSGFMPNSASTSSIGMPLPPRSANQACPS